MIARDARRVAVIVARLGPYHVARLAAAGALLGPECCTAIEVAAENREYAWSRVEARGFRRLTLIRDRDYQDVPGRERARLMTRALDDHRPDAVAVNGWGFSEARAALAWCRRNGRVAILMSDSQETDSERYWLKEAVKRQVIKDCDAALVAGERHASYVAKLGMDPWRIVTGYDVIDNDHFARGADAARHDAVGARRALDLPRDFFLCSARFIPKKNLTALLEAYAAYRREATGPWDLVVVGDGPLLPKLRAQRAELGLDASVLFPGFKQYGDLPAFYGLARAFVLPSTSEQWGLVANEAMAAGLPVLVSRVCGSAELVQEGENGYTFDPRNTAEMARLMARMAREPGRRLEEMGLASRRIISARAPSAFGDGLLAAIEIGEAHLSARRPRFLPNPALWA